MDKRRTRLNFIFSPARLPIPPLKGRVVTVDLAFAFGDEFDVVSKPFIDALGPRLIAWIDHHFHPEWTRYLNDSRFLLKNKREAPACPELITPALIESFGKIDYVYAHADFDGMVAAAKVLTGGHPPYPEADEDARAVDAPGRGFMLSPRGDEMALAIDRSRSINSPSKHLSFMAHMAMVVVDGPDTHAADQREIELLAEDEREIQALILPRLDDASILVPGASLLRIEEDMPTAHKKLLLRHLEERNRVAIIDDGVRCTVATFEDENIDLSSLPGLNGGHNYAWGQIRPEALAKALRYMLEMT